MFRTETQTFKWFNISSPHDPVFVRADLIESVEEWNGGARVVLTTGRIHETAISVGTLVERMADKE